MPSTRSQAQAQRQTEPPEARHQLHSGISLSLAAAGPSTLPDSDDEGGASIEEHLQGALRGVASLRKQIKSLTRENSRLRSDLERLYGAEDVSIQPTPGKKGNTKSIQSLTSQVNKLKREVVQLEEARRKDKRKIQKLQIKEIKRDAAELRDEIENGVSDTSGEMRKLLRRFFELMSSTSMEEKEECAVCLTEMNIETAKSLPCQHIFCADCLPNINPKNCPNCRQPFASLDDTEPIQFTATDQWDALLKVAEDWGRIDKSEDSQGVSDLEEELPFIEEDNGASGSASERASFVDHQSPDEEEGDDSLSSGAGPSSRIRRIGAMAPAPYDNALSTQATHTPTTPPNLPLSYHHSPISTKRQRMQELADARNLKRSRR